MKIFDKKYIGLIIGAVFIVLILKNIDIHKSIEEIKHFNLCYLILMIPVYYLSFLFRAFRWKTILSEDKNIKLSSLLNFLFKGWAVNCIVPARGGEIYRTYYFGKKENISKAKILASIVLERMFDGLVLFLTLFLLVSFVYANSKFLKVSITAGITFSGIFTGLLLISKFYNNAFFQKKIPPKINDYISSFMNGLEVFNSSFLLLKSFLLTIPVWFCEGITVLLLLKGFGYSVGISGGLFVISVLAFASLIPGGPASLGPFQWGYIIALRVFHISQEAAVAISVINQLFIIIFVFSGCLFFMVAEYFNLQSLKEENIPVEE